MSPDSEMERSEMNAWRTEWSTQTPASVEPSSMRDAVIRQEQRLRFRLWANLPSAAILLAGSLVVAWQSPGIELIIWACVIWVETVLVLSFYLWNWQTLLKGSAKPVVEYVALYRDRARASLKEANLGFAFLAIQIGISVPWLTRDFLLARIPRLHYFLALLALLLLAIFFTTFFLHMRREAKREIRQTDDLIQPI